MEQEIELTSVTVEESEPMPIFTEEDIKGYARLLAPKQFKILGSAIDNVVIEPKTDKLLELEFNNVEDYKINAYRQISVESGTNGGKNHKQVIIRSFSTRGQGTKALISIYNFGEEQAVVKVVATCLFGLVG